MLYGTVLAIHAGAMSAALLSFVMSELFLVLARRDQIGPAKMALVAGKVGNLLIGPGVLAGIVLVFVGRWSLLTPWLLASFAVITALMVVRRTFVGPWETRIGSALGSNAPVAEIRVLASEGAALIGRTSVIALFALVVGLMSLKPELALFPQS